MAHFLVGLNGQLPNLDLVNISVQLAEEQGIHIRTGNWKPRKEKGSEYLNRLFYLLNMFKQQSRISESAVRKSHGPHSHFQQYFFQLNSRYRIDSITLSAVSVKPKGEHLISAYQIGQYLRFLH